VLFTDAAATELLATPGRADAIAVTADPGVSQADIAAAVQAAELERELRPLARRARWVRPEAMHLTLRFFGEVPAESVETLGARLSEAFAGLSAFDLDMRGCGVFPERGNPRVLWVGAPDAPGALFELQSRAEAAAPGLLSAIGGPALDYASWMMLADQHTYLPDDILVKVDRAAMAVALETRVPLLDHDLVAWAWSLPLGLKLREGRGKFLLRTLLDEPVPLAAWLRGPLRDWAAQLLDPARLAKEGYLDAERVGHLWREHLAGLRDAQDELWTVLCFEAWLADAR